MAADSKPIRVWDRDKGVAVEEWMPDHHQTTYETRPLRAPSQWLRATPLFDKLYALLQNTRRSARRIAPFVREYGIDISEFEDPGYGSYAEFFEREFKPGWRRYPTDPAQMGARAEARQFGWDRFERDQRFPVKGQFLDAADILGGAERARPFLGAP